MGFLSDLGGFLGDVQQMSEEFDAVKQDVVSKVKDTVLNVESSGNDITTELQSSTDTLTQDVKNATNDIHSQLNN